MNDIVQFEGGVVDQALRLIHKTNGCVSVEALCSRLGVHGRYLQRHFKLRIGVTSQQYIHTIRFYHVFMNLAAARTQHSIERLAILYNYYDISHFNKDYKRHFGVPPSTDVSDKFSLLNDLLSSPQHSLAERHRYLEQIS